MDVLTMERKIKQLNKVVNEIIQVTKDNIEWQRSFKGMAKSERFATEDEAYQFVIDNYDFYLFGKPKFEGGSENKGLNWIVYYESK